MVGQATDGKPPEVKPYHRGEGQVHGCHQALDEGNQAGMEMGWTRLSVQEDLARGREAERDDWPAEDTGSGQGYHEQYM